MTSQECHDFSHHRQPHCLFHNIVQNDNNRKYQAACCWPFVMETHHCPVESCDKGPAMQKAYQYDDAKIIAVYPLAFCRMELYNGSCVPWLMGKLVSLWFSVQRLTEQCLLRNYYHIWGKLVLGTFSPYILSNTCMAMLQVFLLTV